MTTLPALPTITQTQAERVLSRLKQMYGAAEYDPALDITVDEAAAAMNVTPGQARSRLQSEVRQKRLLKRSVVLNGKRKNVYREITPGDDVTYSIM